MIKVLGRKTSGNVQKVLFLLEEAGIAYEREDYGRLFENTKTSEYLALNPTAKVPTVVDGDVVIWESNTILRYLAATQAGQLTGATPAERTEVERWMDFLLAAINAGYLAAFKGSKLAEDERPPEFAGQVKDLHAQLAILDSHIAGKEFFALDKLTLADIALAPIVGRCLNFPLDRPALPNLEAWFDRMKARSAYAAATAG
ncbi:glutathione S-transferase family protein [Oceanibium sediminis]|uniref:glutathione S-transferase family protein n=1 Tax=Oceanibium sediminis TaxID=2026339 RepID=UPI000DD4D302|nr:glutathione S-transferase family protein [Oceanibium sediminis]